MTESAQIVDAYYHRESDTVTFSDVNARGRELVTRYITINRPAVVNVREHA